MQQFYRRSMFAVLLAASTALAKLGEGNPRSQAQDTEDPKLPNGKSQRDAILKAEHEQNLKDAALLVQMAQELQQEIEKDEAFVFSLSTLKKTDDIEKLARKIRARLRH